MCKFPQGLFTQKVQPGTEVASLTLHPFSHHEVDVSSHSFVAPLSLEFTDESYGWADMYRGASPIFDVPEFPPLRRVKPLPKRRRTSESISNIDLGDLTAPDDFLVSDPTADELANTLSTSMALQSYYLPIFSGVQDLLKTNDDTLNGTTTDFGGGMNGAEGHGSGRDDDEQGDGDYIDHLQQPGNTKKRKVPAANISPNGDAQDANSGGEDEPMDRSIPTGGRADAELVEFIPPPTPPETSTLRRGRTTPATNAGLQHKEMLKSRKRQLAAVLGALSHGDTLALDQALSSTYPFSKISMGHMGTDSDGPHVRLSRRPFRRMARAAKHVSGTAVSVDGDENARFPECDFTFEWPSASELSCYDLGACTTYETFRCPSI